MQRTCSDQEVLVDGALFVARRQHVDDALGEALHAVDPTGRQRGREEVGEVLPLARGPDVRSAVSTSISGANMPVAPGSPRPLVFLRSTGPFSVTLSPDLVKTPLSATSSENPQPIDFAMWMASPLSTSEVP